FMEKDKRILEELKSLHCDPHPFCRVFPAESDFSECHGLLCLYCNGCHKYCFRRQVYHCNVNSVGRICHNIFDRNYNAHITMREVLDAVFGLLIIPEPKDPLDSHEAYEQEARKHTEENAGKYLDDMEKV
uniref:UBC core domain-containing protein n=1 Tax=Amphiprion percula TaxID=161767 RepID=A0A3P8UGL9_AMPPE